MVRELPSLRQDLPAPGRAGWMLAAQFVLAVTVVGAVVTISPLRHHASGAARGDVVPDARDAVLVRDLEFLSWYARRRSAGAPTAVALPELPETLGDSESPEGADAQ